MFKSDSRLTKWYNKYNKLYFESKLPETVQVGWDEDLEDDCCGEHFGIAFTQFEDGADFQTGLIRLNPRLVSGARDERLVLLHECCHVKLFPDTRHGKQFQDEMKRLAILDAFRDLW